MSEQTIKNLDSVAETLLITLYIRALESQRPDAMIKDERAVALAAQMGYDFSRLNKIKMDEGDKAAIIIRNRQFDRYARDFLAAHPQAVVVHIGCGLDTRFERVDDGLAEWYDLDLPEVIELRREMIGGEAGRYHLLACSAFDSAWLSTVGVHRPRPFIFLAEGVFMYFEEAQVKSLLVMLRENFPGAELVFDAFSPLVVNGNNLRMRLAKMGARYHWAMKRGKDLEGWADGIRLLDEWFLLDCDEPRLAAQHWMRHIPLLVKSLGIYHYRLG